MEKRNDEIDLIQLFLSGVNTFRANLWLIITFIVLGIGIGLVNYFTSKKVWENKMVVSSGILTRTYAEILVGRVNQYIAEGNVNAVAQALKLTPETIREIHELEIEGLTEVDDGKETDRFIITAETFSQEILPELQSHLVSYLENNEFVKVRVDQNKEYFTQMIKNVDVEIQDMEEWKEKIVSGSFFQNAKGNVMFDPTTINSKILDLKKEKISLQNGLALVNSVQVIEPFSTFQHPSKPKLSVAVISGCGIGIFFVVVVLGVKSLRKIFRMAEAAKNT